MLGGAVTTMLRVTDLVVSDAEVMVTVALPPLPVAGAVYVAPVAVTLLRVPTPERVNVAPLFSVSWLIETVMLKLCPRSRACAPVGELMLTTMGFVLLQPVNTSNKANAENSISFLMVFLWLTRWTH